MRRNRSLAVLGTSDHCIAARPSDLCIALAALDATVVIEGPAGTRRAPIIEFHQLPGNTPDVETTIRPGELITAIELPPTPSWRRRSPEHRAGSRSNWRSGRSSPRSAAWLTRR
jgi:xanthine dehydrogenase YagS FAD-binding subunit